MIGILLGLSIAMFIGTAVSLGAAMVWLSSIQKHITRLELEHQSDRESLTGYFTNQMQMFEEIKNIMIDENMRLRELEKIAGITEEEIGRGIN